MAIPATLVRPQLQNLAANMIMTANYNRDQAFRRSLKVFQKSIYAQSLLNPNLYQQAFNYYRDRMRQIYGILQMPQNMITDINTEILAEPIRVSLVVRKYVSGMALPTRAMVRINMVAVNQMFDLNPESVVQQNIELSFQILYQNYCQLVATNQQIEIIYRDQIWGNTDWRRDFTHFYLPYRYIHCEGYQQWIDFDEDIKLLVSIRFEAIEPNPNPMDLSLFHLYSLFYMVRVRFRIHRSLPNTGTHIHRPSVTKTLTYMRDIVDPNEGEMYWDQPTNQPVPQPPPRPQFVKYIDMQIGLRLGDEMDGQFCTCNEFCNLVAFFYHNPTYRFLLVQHSLLYVRNRTNMTNIYQFALTFSMFNREIPNTLRTPGIGLLASVNYQYLVNRQQFIRDPALLAQYQACGGPNRQTLCGVTYNLVRNRVPMSDICIITNQIRFDEQSLEDIQTYYNILYELHVITGNINGFVAVDNRSRWIKEFEAICRKHFHKFIIWSFNETIAGIAGLDQLFTEDYEYSQHFIDNERERQYIESRKDLLIPQLIPNGNPFNVSFHCERYTHAMIKLWEYLYKFEPKLSRGYGTKSMVKIREFCSELVTVINAAINVPNYVGYRVRLEQQLPQNLVAIEEQMHVFFKLKTYFYAFGIQKYFIHSALNVSRSKKIDENLFFDFESVLCYQWIEQIFQIQYPNQLLFTSDQQLFRHRLLEFYTNFWGKAIHETQQSSPDETMTSVIEQYVRFSHWQQNDGNNRLRFTSIITTFIQSLVQVITDCHSIFRNQILTSTQLMRDIYGTDEHYMNIFDVLVYWLIKGTCFMITRQVTYFLIYIHELEDNTLVTTNSMYLICKPGIVRLFQTKQRVLELLEELENEYFIFDDIFERVSKTINETKVIVKQLYKEYYKKLSMNWLNEIRTLYNHNYLGSQLVIRLHLVNGLSFVAAFIDDFRLYSYRVRKRMKVLRNQNFNQTLIQVSFNQTWDQCLLWLRQVDQIRAATPFDSPLWLQYFQNVFAQYQHLIPAVDQLIQQSNQL